MGATGNGVKWARTNWFYGACDGFRERRGDRGGARGITRGADLGRAVFFSRERFDGVIAAASDGALQPSSASPCRANGPESPCWIRVRSAVVVVGIVMMKNNRIKIRG